MRRLTLGLLCATYLCLSLIVSLTLWRNGGGWGAAVAALVGGLGLCFAFHGLIERALETGAIRGDVENIREAHKILLTQFEALDHRVTEIFDAAVQDAHRSDVLIDEVHMLEDLVDEMRRRLDEQGETPAFPAHLGAAPQAGQAGQPGRSPALLEIVREALTENRVDLYLQPIVALPQRRTQFYESFSRLRDETGRVMMPAEYLTVAEPGGLVTAIDNLLLFRCVQIVRRLAKQDRKIGIFCNVSMASLADEGFFPQFLDLLTANRDLAGALIFEIGQQAFDSRGSVEARNMGKLADLGFRFSLDKVTDLDIDWQDLARSDVKFLKVGAQVLLDELTEIDGRLMLRSLPDLAAEDFSTLTRRYGVEVIAEKIEAERQVVDVLDLNIGFGQGHLFGEPRAIKEAVLSEAGPPPNLVRPQFNSGSPPQRRAAFG
ncbi:MAG TPA: EAL domain-containing protein [Phenylobacterium sp.]|uniref:flagella assembly cyclic-di-GMP phosphodiesterase TipF n=1 Tax=Phenylobacterium sp. TaxID=1871053 RepID=UPI002D60D82D|nr:EAL domain-containing protein [Phenylobacterium sp.]HZZ68550.1 EAL domain-containing protein [Phenylobacterium sp.]